MEVLNGMNDLTTLISGTKIVAFIGILAFLVSCITEVLKTWDWLNERVPTALLVIGLSVVICPVTMLALFAWLKRPIVWYEVFASFIAAFVVALVSMNGWEHVTDLAKRMLKDD